MNTRELGERLERKTIKVLAAQGIRAEKSRRPGRRKGGDLFGVIDILAVLPGELRGVQVGTHNHRAEKVRDICDAELGVKITLVLWRKVKGIWTHKSEVIFSDPSEIPKLIRGAK